MRRESITAVLAVVAFTVICGFVYPLAVAAVGQAAFNNTADGSMVEVDGKPVGSRLIAQSFDTPEYFHPRPSQTKYNPAGTFFNNAGPNNETTRKLIAENVDAYLQSEKRYTPGLTAANAPVDAVTQSASGVDPHISQANADIQANRVSKVRGIPLADLKRLIEKNTDGRFLGVLGEPGVNILELNIAIDKEAGR